MSGRPEVWLSSIASVTPGSGTSTYLLIGSSSVSLPSSAALSTPVVVTALSSEAIGNTESAVTGVCVSRLAEP